MIRRVRRLWFLAGLVFAALLASARAEACATCGAGDPTLTVMGAERPRAGAVRFSLEVEGRSDTESSPDRVNSLLIEGRATLSMSYAPIDRIAVLISMPLSLRDVRSESLTHYTTIGPGDAEVRARAVLLQDRAFAPENLLGVTVGVRAPTSVDQAAPSGAQLPVDAQNGSGAVSPLLGVFFTHLEDPWSFFASSTVSLPFAGRYADMPGPSLVATASLQYRADTWITLRAAIDGRLDAPVSVDGRSQPSSEHAVLFVSPALLWAPDSDLIVQLGLRAPVVQSSAQGRVEGFAAFVSLTVDAS